MKWLNEWVNKINEYDWMNEYKELKRNRKEEMWCT